MKIALVGCYGSGKSTIAQWFCARYPSTELAFADPLKHILAASLSIPLVNFCDPTLKATPLHNHYNYTPRELMEGVGTKLFRESFTITFPSFTQSFWVHCLLRRIELLSSTTHIIVSDVRYDDELIALRERGFVIIALTRTGCNQGVIPCTTADYLLINDGGVEELLTGFQRVLAAVERRSGEG